MPERNADLPDRESQSQREATRARPAQRFGERPRDFPRTEAGSAALLFAAPLIALAWTNSPLSDSYGPVWGTEVSVRAGDAELSMDLRHWITDGLMFLFFRMRSKARCVRSASRTARS